MGTVGRKISLLKIISVILVFTVSFFTGKFIADWGAAEDPQVSGTSSVVQSELPVNRLNVLLLGVDARPGEKDARTDSMVLISIDRDTKKIAMLSIPRDSMVEIDGHGTTRINAANVFGGADLARETVEKLLGVQVPYYVKTNFNGFKDIVDVLGGVTIDVEKRMYTPSEGINLKPGLQRLDGTKALAYVRFRHDALGDIGRTERQQKFLTALAKEMLRPGIIIKAPVLVPKLMDAVETNLGVSDAILVAKAASSLDSNSITTATLPGVFYNYKGASYWKVDEAKAKVVLQDLLNGVRVATIAGPDENVPADKPARSIKQNKVINPVANKQPAEQTDKDNNGQTTPGQSGGNTGIDKNGGQDSGQQGYPNNGGTGSNAGQDQGGQYPGQDQGGQLPDQSGQYPDQSGQYPGQDPGSQTSNQNQHGQVIINGQNTSGRNTTAKPNPPVSGTQTGTTSGSTTSGQAGTPQVGTNSPVTEG